MPAKKVSPWLARVFFRGRIWRDLFFRCHGLDAQYGRTLATPLRGRKLEDCRT
jgi:hypothetical protein